MSTWADIDEQDDHYLGLAGANVVATEALLMLQDNLADVVAARAMMCVHGDAGLGKTLSVNASLRALAPAECVPGAVPGPADPPRHPPCPVRCPGHQRHPADPANRV